MPIIRSGQTLISWWADRRSVKPIHDGSFPKLGRIAKQALRPIPPPLPASRTRLLASSREFPIATRLVDRRPDPAVSADARFTTLLDRTSQPFVFASESGQIRLTNRAFDQMLGYGPGELEGRHLFDITPAPWRETTHHALERLAESGEPQRYEKEYLHSDGRRIPVALVTDYDRDADGRILGTYAFATDISERKKAHAALKASEQRFRDLYDQAPFGYHVIDTEGTILSVNRTECEMLGYDPDEMLGRPIFDFVAERERADARKSLAEWVRAEQTSGEVERGFVTKDGRERIFSIENRFLRDRQGRIAGISSTAQDVTRRRRAETALSASERRLRALYEGIEDAVFVHDLDGQILDANPAACRRLGYAREEFLTLNTRDVDDPEFARGFEDRLKMQLQFGRLSCEGRHRTRNGRLIPVDINTSTIQLEDKLVVLAVIRDITERKALEDTRRLFAETQMRYAREMEAHAQEMARSEARYRQLTESLLDGVMVTDAEGRITLFNRAAERIFGYEANEVLGRDVSVLVPDTECDPLGSFQAALCADDERVVGQTFEVVGVRKSGEAFPVEISLSSAGEDHSRELVSSMRDLTERNRMRAMLLQSEKLASIGLLSAGVAHEINNPLSFIANNLAVLDRDLGGLLRMVSTYEEASELIGSQAPEVAARVREIAEDLDWHYVRDHLGRMLSRTRDGVQRVAGIVSNLRGLARTSRPVFEPAGLADLVDSALEMLHSRIRRDHIEISMDRPSLPKLECVPTQISQVILNLLVNAVQAIEEAHPSGGGRLRIHLDEDAGRQFLEILDNGPGVPPEAMPRLFDPFFTTKPVGEGTGLGLAISHGIITGHGGDIEVESTPGEGTTFRVILPVKAR
jgi:PAS domain S-box-containing protein